MSMCSLQLGSTYQPFAEEVSMLIVIMSVDFYNTAIWFSGLAAF